MTLRPSRLLPERLRLPALLLLAVVCTAAGVWVASYAQRSAATRVAGQARDAQLMLTAMLDQETGMRGYILNGRREFLDPYFAGRRDFEVALSASRSAAAGDSRTLDLIARQTTTARTWQRLAERQLAATRARGFGRRAVTGAVARKVAMDRFRALNGTFQEVVESNRAAQMRDAAGIVVVVIVGLGFGFGLLGMVLIRRGRREREHEQEFAETLQVMRSEAEAHELLREHVERAASGSRVTVLTRNNSADRLEASTGLEDGDPLAGPLADAQPESCLAVRLARPHARAEGAEPLLSCELCGKAGGGSLCQPLLVGGEVLGSVLLRKPSAPSAAEGERLAHSVSRAAPALANLRNLAIAEARAQTDPLTGLANKRAIRDTTKHLHAHATRTGSPLSIVVADLDHFKRVNDTYGHDRGDEALAAAAAALAGTVRGMDFVGRMGGEEFIVLLPDTDVDASLVVAEKLRVAVGAVRLAGVREGLSASLGVATFPDHASDPETLLRLADRALYLAKNRGRNRVELAAAPGAEASVATSAV